METIHLAHLPEDLLVHVALFKEVQNAAFLQEQLLQGNTTFEYAFIDASVIVSTNHLLAAVFRAANDWLNGRLKSKNVHSEIVFCLGMNNNIVESFRRFGISPATSSLFAIKVSKTPQIDPATIQSHLSGSVQGIPVPFIEAEVQSFTDMAKVHKIYKLNDTTRSDRKNGKRGEGNRPVDEMLDGNEGKKRSERQDLEGIILGLMALRGAT
ncbi:MAG: hypothetical protein Q9222_001312 [Ikaeria aurantiellina]